MKRKKRREFLKIHTGKPLIPYNLSVEGEKNKANLLLSKIFSGKKILADVSQQHLITSFI